MKKLIVGFILSFGVFILVGCLDKGSIQAISALDQVWNGGFSYGIVKDKENGTDLYKLKKVDFKNGSLNIGIKYEGEVERDFTITPLLNNERVKFDFDDKGLTDQYTVKIKNGDNKISIKTNELNEGVVSFIFKSSDICFGVYGYNNHAKMKEIASGVKYDELKASKEGANEEIIGKSLEEVKYSFKVELPKERFEGDNYGYKVFLGDTLIKIDGKDSKVFKENNDIFEDEFKFTLPKKVGTYDLYVFREANPISETQPIGSIVFKTKVNVEE